MTRVYYKGAAACVIMFDLTSQQTFNSTIKWKRDLDKKCTLPNGKTIPCILVGNKVSDELNSFLQQTAALARRGTQYNIRTL